MKQSQTSPCVQPILVMTAIRFAVLGCVDNGSRSEPGALTSAFARKGDSTAERSGRHSFVALTDIGRQVTRKHQQTKEKHESTINAF